jgi:predicted AAA+ superfamily ATPase
LSFTRIANIVSSTGAKAGTNTIINYIEYAMNARLINSILLENMVAVNLLCKYGRSDAVYFYNKGIEVDFYLPKKQSTYLRM